VILEAAGGNASPSCGLVRPEIAQSTEFVPMTGRAWAGANACLDL